MNVQNVDSCFIKGWSCFMIVQLHGICDFNQPRTSCDYASIITIIFSCLYYYYIIGKLVQLYNSDINN